MDIFRILLRISGRKVCLLIWRILQRYAYDPKIRSLFKKSRKHHCKPKKTPEKTSVYSWQSRLHRPAECGCRKARDALRNAGRRSHLLTRFPGALLNERRPCGLHGFQRKKLRNRRKPCSALFSGWNCVANRLPRAMALAKRRPPYSVWPATSSARAQQA